MQHDGDNDGDDDDDDTVVMICALKNQEVHSVCLQHLQSMQNTRNN